MKVRWRQRSLRLRVSPRELDALARGEAVTESLDAHPAGWAVTLGAAPPGAATSLHAEGARVTVLLSADDRARFAAPDTEGVYFDDVPSGTHYFVEKDFPCVHPRALRADEGPEETFDAPAEFADRHVRGRST